MLTFDAATHRYFWKGLPVPGVTTVLSPLTDFSAVPPALLERAKEFGTAVHLACEFDDKGQLDADDLDPALAPYVEAWRKFSADNDVCWTGIEEKVFHPVLRYAGTLDRRGTVAGRRAVVDIKSSTSLYPAVGPQLAAYARAVEPDAGAGLRRIAVQLKGDGTYEARDYADPTDWPTFASLLTLRTWCARHHITPKF